MTYASLSTPRRARGGLPLVHLMAQVLAGFAALLLALWLPVAPLWLTWPALALLGFALGSLCLVPSRLAVIYHPLKGRRAVDQ